MDLKLCNLGWVLPFTVIEFLSKLNVLWLRIIFAHATQVFMSLFLCFDCHKCWDLYFLIVFTIPNILVWSLGQIILCIYPLSCLELWHWRKNRNCRCLWNSMPATKYSCWQGRRFFQSNLNVIFPLKHKIFQCTYLLTWIIEWIQNCSRKIGNCQQVKCRIHEQGQSRRRRGNGLEKGRWHMLQLAATAYRLPCYQVAPVPA